MPRNQIPRVDDQTPFDDAWRAVQDDPLYGAAYLRGHRVEAASAATGASFRVSERAGNQAALDLIRKTKPTYTMGAWRKMKTVIRGRLQMDRSPSLRVWNPDVPFNYDYGTPMVEQIRRISSRPSVEWESSLNEVFDRSLFDYSLPSVKAWAEQIKAAACKGKRGAFRLDVDEALKRAEQRSKHV